ncbi:MAG: XRE family transcriptional regulator [Candidatus Omnitrophota bacterium]
MKIGQKIRELRKEKNVTLEGLSKKSNVALATLSRMENDKMRGTIKSHLSICKALGVSVSELYRELEDTLKTVETTRKRGRTEHFVHSRKAVYELLVTETLSKKMMPLFMKITPGGETQKEINSPLVEKFVYVVNGSLEAFVGEKNYTLQAEDSLYFDASLPHNFKNTSPTTTEALCIIA